jgi:hypothetical protein
MKGTSHEDQYTFLSYLAQIFVEWKMFPTKVVERIDTHILCFIPFSSENRAVYEIMWENCVERGRLQMTIWRMRLTDTWGYKHTLTMCNTYCFTTASNVVRTRLSVTFICTLPVLLIIFVDNGFVHRSHKLRAHTQTCRVVILSKWQLPCALLRSHTYVFHAIPLRTFSRGSRAPSTAPSCLQFWPLPVRPVAYGIYWRHLFSERDNSSCCVGD